MGILGELFMLCRLFIGARVIEIVREFSVACGVRSVSVPVVTLVYTAFISRESLPYKYK